MYKRQLLWYEVTRDLPLKEIEIETPVATARSKVISGTKMALVPILRSGIAMAEGIESIMPALKIGHLGVYRETDTLQPDVYKRQTLCLSADIPCTENILGSMDGKSSSGARPVGTCLFL